MTEVLTKAGMARQKFPEELHVLQEMPMNSIGKILKQELQMRFGAKAAQSAAAHVAGARA